MQYQIPKRMEVWNADLPLDENSSIQGGYRPVLIVSNDICNEKNNVVTVVPLTSQIKRLSLPTHVLFEVKKGEESLALLEQITTIEKKLLCSYVGTLKRMDRRIVEAAMRDHLGLKAGGKKC